MSQKQLAIGTLIEAYGLHPAAWLAEEAEPGAPTEIEYFKNIAQICERGKFDFYFIADTPAARTQDVETWARSPMYMNQLEPITLLTALAGATSKIGLAATASTSFYEPYNLARLYASLDHISGGRAGWNIVTSANDYAARNFGADRLPPHAKRYAKAKEFYDVVTALWDTWEDDAFVYDKEEGYNFLPEKMHMVDHEGEFFKVNGALNIARSPQGYPVILEAGASETGKEFAAQTAEAVFGVATRIEDAIAFYKDLKGRMPAYGRNPDHLKVLAGATIVVGDSAEEAKARFDHWQSLIHPDVGLLRIKQDIETDLSDLPLDEPVPEDRIPAEANHHRAYFDEIAGMIRRGLTLREICQQYTRSKVTIFGSPEEIADMMQEWLDREACDGFMITFPVIPSTLEDFVEKVVPILQARGIFREDYTGSTLREHLGLPRPENRHVVASADGGKVVANG
ncbi:LLM class flavin-dependent oxidoreductase [Salipiger mucosus]|uniref:Nitrilotriacetate monooxygenase component A n=1 Tax=Salipiger mucosus DSM 16094 TaxID=1123237 RepID=S9Q5K5_9RHOB|nr:LLM class flavin-dependent oxidoreductase [Salipiger mucosus]EPX76616.1 Nitrilotriacetate monooxygenase component A [Salipiger mucosus DSM 16094]